MHEKPVMVVDETNRKIRETPIRDAQAQERAMPPGEAPGAPELAQRQVTSPLDAPDNIVAEIQQQPLSKSASENLGRLQANYMPPPDATREARRTNDELIDTRSHGGRLERDDNHKLPQSKVEHRPTPRNRPMIEDVPVTADWISGTLPENLKTGASREVTIAGVIESIDRQTGHLVLNIGSVIEICLPPAAVQDLLVKDRIAVRVRTRQTS